MSRHGHESAWRAGIAALACAAGLAACGAERPRTADHPAGDPVAGRSAIQVHGCAACHAIPGITGPRGAVGPPLDAWPRRAYIAGRLPNEPDALVRWLIDPPSIVPNTAMPPTGLTEREARDIAAYLFGLD